MTSPRGRRGWTLWRTLERAMPMFASEQRDDIRYLSTPVPAYPRLEADPPDGGAVREALGLWAKRRA